MSTSRYEDYLKTLKGAITPIAKLEFMNADNATVAFEITDDFITGGTLSVAMGNGTRRSADITLLNANRQYEININKIWFGQQVRLYMGILLHDGTEFYLPQGVFYIKNPDESFSPTSPIVSLNLVDKWSFLDGSLFGQLGGTYQINVGDNLFVAIQQLLLTDRGNGISLDSVPPVLDSYFKDKTVSLTDGSVVPIIEAPYTIRIEAGRSYADILLEIATMLVATIGYDCNGQLRIESAQTDILDEQRPSQWNFSVNEAEFLSANYTNNMTELFNDIKVIGAVLNGTQIQARATNNNPMSDCNVARIGYKTKVITQSKYSSFDQCSEHARYELRRSTTIPKSASFSTSQIFHLRENDLVTLLRSQKSDIPEKHLVRSFSLPIGSVEPMSIETVPLSEFDIFKNWLSSHQLTVLCSDIGALQYVYGDTPTTVNLTNPYVISEIPENNTVSFSVTTDPLLTGFAYTIHSVALNGTPLQHDGTNCSFVMPNYDSTIVFQLSATSGNALTASYSGTHTSSVQTINGISYNVFEFTTSGTLTLDSTQVTNGILVDLWVRGAGGGSSSSQKGRNAHDLSENSIKLTDTSISITIGSGGTTGTTSGTVGETTSFGDYLSAAGGRGASSYAITTKEGELNPIFGSITNTTNGAGGAIGSDGQSGICYMRIAMKS